VTWPQLDQTVDKLVCQTTTAPDFDTFYSNDDDANDKNNGGGSGGSDDNREVAVVGGGDRALRAVFHSEWCEQNAHIRYSLFLLTRNKPQYTFDKLICYYIITDQSPRRCIDFVSSPTVAKRRYTLLLTWKTTNLTQSLLLRHNHTHTITTDLKPATMYRFRLVADRGNESASSPPSSQLRTAPPTPPTPFQSGATTFTSVVVAFDACKCKVDRLLLQGTTALNFDEFSIGKTNSETTAVGDNSGGGGGSGGVGGGGSGGSGGGGGGAGNGCVQAEWGGARTATATKQAFASLLSQTPYRFRLVARYGR
jgi:hypothetical protein